MRALLGSRAGDLRWAFRRVSADGASPPRGPEVFLDPEPQDEAQKPTPK